MRRGFEICLILAVTLGTWCGTARALTASDKQAIRSLSNQAASEYDQGQYDSALNKFQRAYGIAKVPRLAVWLAQCNVKLGRLVAAHELYREAISLQPNDLWKGDLQQQAQKEAQAALEQLQPRLPKLTISIEGADVNDVTVSIDDTPIPGALIGVERPVDPGTRQIVAKRGAETQRKSVTLAESDVKKLSIAFSRVSQPAATGVVAAPTATQGSPGVVTPAGQSLSGSPVPDSSVSKTSKQKTWGWVSVSVGAASLAVGATTGILVAIKNGNLQDKCSSSHVCDRSYESDVNSYQTLRSVSTAGFIVGGVAAAAGVTLLLTAPKKPSQPTVGLWLSPNTAGIKGDF